MAKKKRRSMMLSDKDTQNILLGTAFSILTNVLVQHVAGKVNDNINKTRQKKQQRKEDGDYIDFEEVK